MHIFTNRKTKNGRKKKKFDMIKVFQQQRQMRATFSNQ